MDWSYIAGFFDGEGNVGKPQEGNVQLVFCNTNRAVLEEIQTFIQCGKVYLINKADPSRHARNDYFQLRIFRHEDVLRLCETLIPFSRIKRAQLAWTADYIRNKSWLDIAHPGRDEKGRWLATKTIEVRPGDSYT